MHTRCAVVDPEGIVYRAGVTIPAAPTVSSCTQVTSDRPGTTTTLDAIAGSIQYIVWIGKEYNICRMQSDCSLHISYRCLEAERTGASAGVGLYGRTDITHQEERLILCAVQCQDEDSIVIHPSHELNIPIQRVEACNMRACVR